jgi:mevalonate kinase
LSPHLALNTCLTVLIRFYNVGAERAKEAITSAAPLLLRAAASAVESCSDSAVSTTSSATATAAATVTAVLQLLWATLPRGETAKLLYKQELLSCGLESLVRDSRALWSSNAVLVAEIKQLLRALGIELKKRAHQPLEPRQQLQQ